ncbi:MAG: hypothetical protein JWO40_669 [Candidatus Doudnabacteria bacterium]|nr:hypothetical protein [Candidatus Doudnabacteria bacterium]
MSMAQRLVKDTEPHVQRFYEPYRETGMGLHGPASVGLCVSTLAERLKKMPENKPVQSIDLSKTKNKILVGFFILTFAFMTYAMLKDHFLNTPSENSATTQPQEIMNLKVLRTTAMEAMGSEFDDQPVFTIKNLNSLDWANCDLTLNDSYKSHLDFIDIPSELQSNPKDTHDTMVVTQRNFYKSDGTAFNPLFQKPLNFSVTCHGPYLGTWAGEFAR